MRFRRRNDIRRNQKAGYEPIRLSHRVGDNDERLRNLLLDVLKRKLYVDSQPRAARVFVENRYIGETPTEIGPFEEGKRVRIRLERDGFESVSLRHRVGRGDDNLSRISLNQKAPDTPASQGKSDRVRYRWAFKLKNTCSDLNSQKRSLSCVF